MASNAPEAYRAARERIELQLRQIRDLLHTHANRATAQPHHFGFVGDLTHISELLNEVATALRGETT